MTIDLLAVDIGNTQTQLGAFVDGQCVARATVAHQTPDQWAEALATVVEKLAEQSLVDVYLGSVCDVVAEQWVTLINEATGYAVVRVEREAAIPIGRQLDPESLIGEDRLLNAAAAYEQVKEACVIVDAGTAVTIDFVDGEGTFHGGAILPGVQMMLDAMHQGTEQLPALTFDLPEETVGHRTSEAMLCGVYHGVRGAVRELIERYAEQYQAWPRAIATGGSAAALFPASGAMAGHVIDRIVDDLTLQGLYLTKRSEVTASEEA